MTSTIDLAVFCCTSDTDYLRKDPWVFNGHRYAGSGFILVRVPAEGEPDANLPKKPEDQEKLFAPIGETLPWPTDGARTGTQECFDCDGIGKVDQDPCSTCNGTGSCTHCGGECGQCDGKGIESLSGNRCKTCKGVGRIEDVINRRVGIHLIRGAPDRHIRTLPNVRYGSATDPNKPLPFVFDGGSGLVMGVRDGIDEGSP